MHNKFWIFDEQTVWTGSTNITVNGMLRNNNNVIVIRSSRLADIYEDEFQEMWWGDFGPSSPSRTDEQRLIINDTSVQVLFAAEDEVMQHLAPLVQGAQESIHFMAFSFTHPDLGAAMLERAQAGVDVQGIFETRGSETQYSQLPPLYCAGLPVRQDGNPATFHHKVIVIDGQTVVTGSYNFSLNADEENDENMVIISHRNIAQAYLDEFQRQWALAGPPDAEEMGCE
jgi:phosphatidylserine/phosphatidylglycerophosphate/cardiolipin synthase-like enzyme